MWYRVRPVGSRALVRGTHLAKRGAVSADLRFWDASFGQELAHLNDSLVSLAEIPRLCALRAERGPVARRPALEPLLTASMESFHPLAVKRPQQWERAIGATLFAVSGQLPDRQELVHGREVLDALPRRTRASLEPAFVLGTLAPLLLGFRLSRAHPFVNEANRHRDATAVMNRLLREDELVLEVPLCAHRERVDIAPRRLTHAPDRLAFARVCGLLQLLLANARPRRSRIRFLQQGPTDRAAACMFPSVFSEYAVNGELDRLLATLAHHQRALADYVAPYQRDRVSFECADLDPLSIAAERDLEQAFGPGWLHTPDDLDPRRIEATWAIAFVAEEEEAPLSTAFGRATLSQAVRHVGRFMPEVGAPMSLRSIARSADMSSVARDALGWFERRSTMSRAGRALFELAFYRRWALTTRAQDGIGLGFDRDFSRFQHSAWTLAYGGDDKLAIPLLYARRTLRTEPGGALRNLSYRQFWVSTGEVRGNG